MKPIRFAVFALCAATVCSMPKVRAETVVPQAQAATQVQSATIDLRNIKPSVMAFWLDPQRETSPDAKKMPLLQVDASLVVLPLGIESITAFDKTNQLSISGSQEGIERVLELVDFLDKPIPMIEVQVQYIHLSKSARLTGDSFNASYVSISALSQNEELKKLIASGKAQVIGAPRIQTFNKSQAEISDGRTGYYTRLKGEDGVSDGYLPAKWQRKLTTIATLNSDDSITVSTQFFEGFVVRAKETEAEAEKKAWLPYNPMPGLPESRIVEEAKDVSNFGIVKVLPAGAIVMGDLYGHQVSTTANIKDGDTLVIGGLRSEKERSFSPGATTDMLIISAHVVKLDSS